MFASKNFTAGQLNAIVKMLGGEERAHRFLNNELIVLDRRPVEHVVWKTVTLGLHKTVDDYFESFRKKGMRCDYRDEFTAIEISSEVIELELVAYDIPIDGVEVYPEPLISSALRSGLEYCPQEVILALRDQYYDQYQEVLDGDYEVNVMTQEGALKNQFFAVHCDHEENVLSIKKERNSYFHTPHLCVFVRRRKFVV